MTDLAKFEVSKPGELPIPDLSHLWEDDTEEVETQEPVEQEEVAEEEVEEEEAPVPVQEVRRGREKDYKNPNARIRILEKEKKERDKKYDSLAAQVERLAALIEKQLPAQQEEADEEIDENLDPLGATLRSQKKIEKELEEIRKSSEEKKRTEEENNTISEVNREIQQWIKEDEVADSAIRHISVRMRRVLEREHPDLDENELLEVMNIGMRNMKLDIAKKGLDPVEFLMNMAEDMGFDPNNVQKPTQRQKPVSAERDKIRTARAKADGTGGLGATPGRSAGKPGLGSLFVKENSELGASEMGWKLKQLVKDGALRPGDSPTRLPKVSDILKGKGRAV